MTLPQTLRAIAEEYDVARQRQVGNFPQAFSHLALIVAACDISSVHEGLEGDEGAADSSHRRRVQESPAKAGSR